MLELLTTASVSELGCKDHRIVMYDRGASALPGRFVVWFEAGQNDRWWGSYHETVDTALPVFMERAARLVNKKMASFNYELESPSMGLEGRADLGFS